MKKIVLFLFALFLLNGNVFSQVKKAPVKRATNSVTAKQKAEAEAKAKAEAEAKTTAEAEEAKAREIESNNLYCRFGFGYGKFVSLQPSNVGFVVYEIPGMSASELKSSALTTLSSMYKSPKDAITPLSDNMIQLEGYAESVFFKESENVKLKHDILFDIIIQFKDGKVRYNAPTIKMLYVDLPILGMRKCDMNKGISSLIDDSISRKKVENYFNNLINSINSTLKQSNNW